MVSLPLLHNHWFGKAIGGIAGLLLSPIGWAPSLAGFAIGLVCGALFDRWASRYIDAIDFLHRPLFGSQFHPDPTRPSLRFAFAGMGRIAKASGQVQPAHIAYAEHLMQRLQFSAADRRQAIDAFTEGKAPDFPFGSLAQRSLPQLQQAPVLLDMILESLCRTTLLEDNAQARSTLYTLTDQLGLPRETACAACDRFQELLNDPDAVLRRAHEILGTSPELSAKAIRTAYRRQIARHHPDRLPANASTAQKQAADRRMTELREALDLTLDARTSRPSTSRQK